MSQSSHVFDQHALFDPAGDLEAFLRSVPGKWVVYLMSDEHDRPVQLLCVRNLRASLKRRLGGLENIGPTRRVAYREVIRHVHWTRVDSALEADWQYLEAARRLFPKTYRGMVGFRPAWFVHVDPEARFPRYVKTSDLSDRAGVLIGPIEDKHAAARLVELADDGFDLCRYWSILTQSPDGKACAYKQIGKCPAPCDGTISMESYRQLVDFSLRTIVSPGQEIVDQTERMKTAAAEMEYELAGKIKQHVEQLRTLGTGAFGHISRLEELAYVCLQKGPWAQTVKLLLIRGGQVRVALGLIGEPDSLVLRSVIRSLNAMRVQRGMDETDAERLGVVSHHLYSEKFRQGVFLRLDGLDERALARAYAQVLGQKPQEEADDEGVMKELVDL